MADNVLNGPSTAISVQPFSNVGTSTDHSLPVSVSVFSAKSDYGKISLSWETASEVDNEGFYLSRADNGNGPFTAINPRIIQGSGNSNETHKYEFVDDNVVEDATYYYKLSSQDFNGARHDYPGIASGKVLPLPKVFSLNQNYPNPFNPSTQISFAVANESTVNLDIYNMLGQKVRTLINNQRLEPGVYNNYSWNARDDNGNSVANGIYYMVLTAKEFQFRSVKKIIYMK
ncbi:MAG: FlgD immunoglobulin-like domain containing protein [Calditrichia bacterium]